MSARRAFLVGLVSLITGATSNFAVRGESPWLVRRTSRRVHPTCSIPERDYQHGARTPSYVFRSLPAIDLHSKETTESSIAAIKFLSTLPPTQSTDELIERFSASQALVERASRPRAKLFQIARNSITIEHCSISDIALQIEPSGKWLLRLRGDQNPIEKTEELIRNKDIHIRRNAFRVQVRLLTTARSNGENRTPLVEKQPLIDQAGKLALVSFDVEEFWVQREAPMYIAKDGYEHGIVNSFADIDQAEFEFFVRLDPLTGSGKGVVQPWHREP